MIPFEGIRRALVLAPHTDDAELGCGGSIARLAEAGVQVEIVAFSNARESLPAGFGPNTLPKEARAAAEALGLPGSAATVLDFPVRYFHAHRQEILEWMVARRRQLPPDLVFAPASTDFHQDHAVIHQEAVRGFRGRVLLGYELPWNNRSFSQTCGIALKEHHVAAKVKALSRYESQAHRPYIQEAVLKGWAMTRGVTFNTEFAEAFEALQITIPLP